MSSNFKLLSTRSLPSREGCRRNLRLASAEFGLKVFKNLLEKDKRQPEYAGGASLVSAFLIHFPDQWESILEISKVKINTIGTLHSIETAKTWALNVANNPLAAKLKQNQNVMELISKLLTQIEEFILSTPLGEFSEQEIHEIRHKKIVDRLTQGREYLKKKEYSKVEELLNSIFAAYEKDGEALFLDARLFWLKSGSAEEEMKRRKKFTLSFQWRQIGKKQTSQSNRLRVRRIGKMGKSPPFFSKSGRIISPRFHLCGKPCRNFLEIRK